MSSGIEPLLFSIMSLLRLLDLNEKSVRRCVLVVSLCLAGAQRGSAEEIPVEENLARANFHVAAFAPNGKVLVTATAATAQLWDVESGKLLRQFVGHTATVNSVALSADGRSLLTAGGDVGPLARHDPTARIWNVETGAQSAVFEAEGNYVSAACISPDGERILTMSTSNTTARLGSQAEVWDRKSGRRAFVLEDVALVSAATNGLTPLVFSQRGELLAGLTDEGRQLCVWSARTGELVWKQVGALVEDGRRATYGGIGFSRDGRRLLVVCSDRSASVWSAGMGSSTAVFEGHTDRIRAAAFCGDGERVLTASLDATARLWSVDSGELVRTFDHPGPVVDLAVNRDGDRVATRWRMSRTEGTGGAHSSFVSLWDVSNGRELRRLPTGQRGRFLFDPSGKRVLVWEAGDHATLLDAKTGATVRRYNGEETSR
ncbi:MAG: WD40 repeat domain-containing protein [Pirellulaceae bacterium]